MPTESRGPGPRVLVVLGGARAGGLCRRLTDGVLEDLRAAGIEPRFHDLLADGFDPVLRLEPDQRHAMPCDPGEDSLTARYQADARWAEAFVVLHPIWWFAPPAILKGWIDRVLVHDVALEHGDGSIPRALFTGKRMLVVQTFNSRRAIDRLAFLGVSSFFWKRVVGAPIGIERVTRLALYGVESLTEARLKRFEGRLRRALGALTRDSQGA